MKSLEQTYGLKREVKKMYEITPTAFLKFSKDLL
jgi:hypothetical protein